MGLTDTLLELQELIVVHERFRHALLLIAGHGAESECDGECAASMVEIAKKALMGENGTSTPKEGLSGR